MAQGDNIRSPRNPLQIMELQVVARAEIEPSKRGLTIRGPQTRTPARGRGSLLQCLGGAGVPITEGQRLFFLDRLNVVDDVHDPGPGDEVHALHTGHTIEASSS